MSAAEEKLARMNEPRASLDHFIGRSVENVIEPSDADVPSNWAITLEGGIVISNKDNRRTVVPDVRGKSLLFVALDESETRLQFGVATPTAVQGEEWVVLTPTKYTLAGLEGQTREFYPQMPVELEDVLLPDPSSERVVEGPQEATEEAVSDGEE